MTAAPSRPARMSRSGERPAVFAVFLALGLCMGGWATALPALKAGLALTDRELSAALLCFALGSIVSTVAGGALASRLGTLGATRAGLVATVATLPLPAAASSLATLSAATLALGLAQGLLDVAMNGHAGALEGRRGRPMMSSFHGAFSLGGLGGAAVGGALAGAGLGAAAQLWAAAALAALVGVGALPALGPGGPLARGGTGLAWPSRRLVGLGVITAFCFAVEGAVGDWSAIYLDTVAGSGLAAAAAGYAGFSVAMAASRFGGDRAVAVLGQRRILVGGGLVAGAGLLAAVLLPAPLPAAVGFALVGLGLGNVAPVAFSAAGRTGATPAGGIAPVATVGYAGFLLGPPIIGTLSSFAGLRGALACLVLATGVVVLVGAHVSGRRSLT